MTLDKRRWKKRGVEKKLRQQRRLEQAAEYRKMLQEKKRAEEEAEERLRVEKKLRVRFAQPAVMHLQLVVTISDVHRDARSGSWRSESSPRRTAIGKRSSGTKR